MIQENQLRVGGFSITPPIAIGSIGVGATFILLAFRSRQIRKASGLVRKVRLLASDYGQGPDQWGRVFFAGVAFVLIGFFRLFFLR